MKNLFYIIPILMILSACSDSGGGSSGSTGPVIPELPTLCSDTNSSNAGSSIPCLCNGGYLIDASGTTCTLIPTPGVVYTYSSIYGAYSPLQSGTTACTGTVTTNRTFTCQRSDTVIVANSNCSADSSPTSTIQSKTGTVNVTPTNPSLINGIEQMTCAVGATSGTRAVTCNVSYHLAGASLATNTCDANVISCTLPTGASTATQTWNGSSYGTCTIGTCNTASNYIKVSNSCVLCAYGEVAQVNNTCLSSEPITKLNLLNASAFQIVSNSQTRAWGNNIQGRLGVGDTTNKSSSVNLTFPSSRYPIKIYQSFDGSFTYAIMDNGSLMSWGANASGQLGVGDTVAKSSPTLVNLGTGKTIKKLVLGGWSACAILNDGTLACWGYNVVGELGTGSTSSAVTSPTQISLGAGRTVFDVAMSNAYGNNQDMMCVVLDDYSLKCTGYNSNGQLGDGTYISKISLTTISLGPGITARHVQFMNALNDSKIGVCIFDNSSNLRCWGDNTFGRLGVGDIINKITPTLVSLGSGKNIKTLVTSNLGFNSCAILNDDLLKCWGRNYFGQLGDNSVTDRWVPTTAPLGTSRTVKSYVANGSGSYAILDNNVLLAWGQSFRGELGISGNQETPQIINIGANLVKALTTSAYSTCILTTANKVMCSGDNISGSLGTGSLDGSSATFALVDLGTGRTAVELYTSNYSTCALLDNNAVKCWGSGNSGQLGNGATTSQSVPVQVL